jgi:hypothetical protein
MSSPHEVREHKASDHGASLQAARPDASDERPKLRNHSQGWMCTAEIILGLLHFSSWL